MCAIVEWMSGTEWRWISQKITQEYLEEASMRGVCIGNIGYTIWKAARYKLEERKPFI